ncbi:MAG: hypothetical protein DRG09_06950, partial [Epsilonproteobacteria bacterium]
MAKIEVIVKDGATAPLRRIKRAFNSTNTAVNEVNDSSKQMYSSMTKLAGAFVGVYAGIKSIQGISSIGASFVKTSAQFEQFETTLRSITGSSEEARKSMKWIEDFGSKTPYELDKVTESFVKMKAYGLDPMDGTLTALGNASSAMGKDITQAVEAMADAVTGENERLKEFGIKASKTGETIAYNWADSSGKMRKIVIKNNKDIIQSTLTAIFNEKYVGAMDAQSKTWNGMLSNMADSWTIFKKDVMNEGLFNYLKGILTVVGELMAEAFGGAKDGAKDWSDNIITGIEGVILWVGNMTDVINGIDLAWTVAKNGAIEFFLAISKAGDFLEDDWGKSMAQIQNVFGKAMYGLKVAWSSVINYFQKKWVGFYGTWVKGFNALAEFANLDIKIEVPEFAPAVVAGYKDILYAQKGVSKETLYWKNQLQESDKDLKGLYASVENEDGRKKAVELIGRV